MRILIVEDERVLAESLQRGLAEEGYVVDFELDGRAGMERSRSGVYDAAILDWRLPGISGKDIVRTLREEENPLPVIMLTAFSDVDHRIEGLDAGADDYLAKPFSFEELLARLRALFRRSAESEPKVELQAGPLLLNPFTRNATLAGEVVSLRSKEFLILESLARRPGNLYSRTVLCERVWGSGYAVADNTIDVTVSNLRSRLKEAAEKGGADPGSVQIETIRGMGYRLVVHSGEER